MDNFAASLSDREKEVLSLVSEGYSAKKIASNLFIAESTVNTYKKNLYIKLNCENIAHLVRRGFEIGVLKITESTISSS